MKDALDSFEIVWSTVKDSYFDSDFGGVETMLPNGALFVYPNRQYRTPDGAVLEGRGGSHLS